MIERSRFWRRARRDNTRTPTALPDLPLGTLVRVPGRGDVFVRYQPGPPGAPTVLLLHGWMASADLNWWPAFGALAGSYHVLAVDHRGHGRGIRSIDRFTLEDCADDAAFVLDALDVRRAFVAGYSMGGPIALLLARRHRDVVRGLVLVATAAELGRSGMARGMGVFVELFGPLARSGVGDLALRHVVRARPDTLGELAELAPWLAGEFKRSHPGDIIAAGRALAAFDARPWLDEIDVPVTSVITGRDLAVRPVKQRATASALAARIIDVDAGHALCTTQPDLFGASVRQAVNLVAAQRRLRLLTRAGERLWRTRGPVEKAAVGA